MGFHLQRLAWAHMPADMGAPARLLYVWFCDRAIEDQDNTTWAFVADMMAATGTNDANTRVTLADLRRRGLVERLSPNGHRGRAHYRVRSPLENERTPPAPRLKTSEVPRLKTSAHPRLKTSASPLENERTLPIEPLINKRENSAHAPPPPVASATLSQKALYETFVRVLGRPPQAGRERGKWLYGVQHLHDAGITPPEIPRLVTAYRDKYGPEIPCHPGTIHDHLPILKGASHVTATSRAADADSRAAAAASLRLETLKARHAAGRRLPPAAYAELAAAGIHATPPDATE